MKISEARQIYSNQIRSYNEQQVMLSAKKQELGQKMDAIPDGKNVYANEAATLELTINAVEEKKTEYQKYMDKLLEQWSATVNMASAEQQGDAMAEYAEDMGKILEVARRIMKGGIVPASDEKKLMDFSMELYQTAKNMGAMAKEKEEYDTLWEEKAQKEYEDPMETADNAEAYAAGPEVADVADTIAGVTMTSASTAPTTE